MLAYQTIEMPLSIAQQLAQKEIAAPEMAQAAFFNTVMTQQGQVFRDVPGRKTLKIRLGEESYFIKQHFGVGWAEIFKNLLTLKWPIVSAKTEELAIEKLNTIGIHTTPLVAYGKRGFNPARLQSFLITRDLGNVLSLEDVCADWINNPPTAAFKRKLIIAVAKLAAKLHQNGLTHRDFYLCHLCIDADKVVISTQPDAAEIDLYLIDLHRMQIKNKPVEKAVMKDMAALFFSAKDIGLTARDYLRFKYYYEAMHTPKPMQRSAPFWHAVVQRADKLYARFHSDKFQQKLAKEKSALNA